ncbi:MAG: N-acetylmuramoyl-L-alanine amidase, partial [Pseudomonadota bacterium]
MTTKKAAKLAVIVGHNNRAQGAFSASPLNMTEYVFNKSIALDMETMSTPEMEIEVFFRKAGLGYRKEIAEVYSRVDKWIGKSKGATIELHFNSFNGSSIGTETLSSGTVESLAFAEEVQEELLSVLARRKKADRGVKIRGSKERG